jgi:hypothetical protein
MISPTPIKGYAYGAIAALRNLPEDQQRQIELLRADWLPTFAEDGTATVFSNFPDLEYRLAVPLLKLVLKYYLHSSDRTAIVFAIERA